MTTKIREKISNIKIEKSVLLENIKEYVYIINPSLFKLAENTNKFLLDNRYGSVDIIIDKKQPYLFPQADLDFSKYPAKKFPALIGSMHITINAFEKITLNAKILFGRSKGKITWGKGDEDLFFSECHLAQDNAKFGKEDIFDLISFFYLGEHIVYGDNGELTTLRHPVDVI